MKRTLILITAFSVSIAHPVIEEKMKISVTVAANMESTKVSKIENHFPSNSEAHATIKCEHIHPEEGLAGPENDKACESHCQILTPEYSGGECREGVCHCRRELVQGKRAWGADDPHPTVKCVDLITEEEEERSENDEICQLHCKSLKNGYKKGECAIGICFCSQQI